jgi:hypothetical protein
MRGWVMRGGDWRTGELFSYVDPEGRVRWDHPLRPIWAIVNEALAALEREFAALYAPIGRPSIPPAKRLGAMLCQAFYSIRSERQLMERLEYHLLFRCFVGLGVELSAPVWANSFFSRKPPPILSLPPDKLLLILDLALNCHLFRAASCRSARAWARNSHMHKHAHVSRVFKERTRTYPYRVFACSIPPSLSWWLTANCAGGD